MGDVQRKFELTGPQIAGSALAAATAAVAASYLGVAGTVIGAALVSVGTTVGTAVYAHYLERTGEKVKRHTVSAQRGHAAATTVIGGSPNLVASVEEAPRRRLPWARVAIAAGLVFAISMGGILTYQTVADRTVAEQLTGKPARKAAPTKPAADRDKDAASDVPARPMRTVTTPSVSPSPSPAATPALTPALTPAPVATPTLTTASMPASESTPAPVPTDTAGASDSPHIDASSPGQEPSPLGAVPGSTEPANPRPPSACPPIGEPAPMC
ncbi:hypothetical protein SAMN05444920_109350 [Nonomuraea solani]|uniref:Uncharacterized protein n=1 Tax=Nonomuraea solani TaxID=1144553 RepID=A0A1H6EEX2_9ACTN|nr:hypothetical protein [Nonomuraea solani]SEG96332.1 hypothetical protein SAMN05444920_109350 [Nonomuraea solani]